MNRTTLIGQVGRQPETRFTQGGRPVVSFSVGASSGSAESGTDAWGETVWFNVLAWDAPAKTCLDSVASGRHVYVEGCLQTQQRAGSRGETRVGIEIRAQDVMVLGDEAGSVEE